MAQARVTAGRELWALGHQRIALQEDARARPPDRESHRRSLLSAEALEPPRVQRVAGHDLASEAEGDEVAEKRPLTTAPELSQGIGDDLTNGVERFLIQHRDDADDPKDRCICATPAYLCSSSPPSGSRAPDAVTKLSHSPSVRTRRSPSFGPRIASLTSRLRATYMSYGQETPARGSSIAGRKQLDDGPDGAFDARWTPARDEVAISLALWEGDPSSRVAVATRDGKRVRPLTRGGDRRLISSSPDGTELIHGTFDSGGRAIWSVPIRGGPSKLMPFVVRDDRLEQFEWSSDGRRVVASLYEGGLVTMDTRGRNLVHITHGDDSDPHWSPDGRSILFTRMTCDEEGIDCGSNVYVVSADGTDPHALTDDPYDSAIGWSPTDPRCDPASCRGDRRRWFGAMGDERRGRAADTARFQPSRVERCDRRLGAKLTAATARSPGSSAVLVASSSPGPVP